MLNHTGNPYTQAGYDDEGETGVDFGIYATPETFVIGPNGNILYKQVGVIDQDTGTMKSILLLKISKLMRFLFLLLSCMLLTNTMAEPAVNAVTTTYKFASQEDARRFSDLTSETRCVVCQFQNIADSNAPLAGSIREKIYHLIQEKKI